MSTETALQLKNTLKKMGLKFQNPKLIIFFKDYNTVHLITSIELYNYR